MAIEQLRGKPWYVGFGVGAGVVLVLVLLAQWQIYGPLKQEIQKKDRRISELEAKIQEGRAAKQRLPQFREEVRRLELELDKLLRILPARRNIPDILRRVKSLAEQGDLDILRVVPSNPSDRDFYSEWPIQIALNGTYHNLALFFDRIGRFSRIINVDNLQAKGLDPARNDGRTVSANFTAKTFVYREVELEPQTPAENGGRRGGNR